jgi:DNA-binding NarL/FixJ family response regulator
MTGGRFGVLLGSKGGASVTGTMRDSERDATTRAAQGREAPSGRTPIRVVLGEDDFLAREGMTRVLEGLDGIELIASSGELNALRAAIEREHPDVVVTELRMPPGFTDEGISLAAELRSTHPEIGVVVVSECADPRYATELFARGSSRRGYLLKGRVNDADRLARVIEEVARGGAVLDPSVVDGLMSDQHERSPITRLTRREREVLELIAEGYSNTAIAERLEITRRGVERHVSAIFSKLALAESTDTSPRVRAALLFLRGEGLIDTRRH